MGRAQGRRACSYLGSGVGQAGVLEAGVDGPAPEPRGRPPVRVALERALPEPLHLPAPTRATPALAISCTALSSAEYYAKKKKMM